MIRHSPRVVRAMVAAGQIPHVKIGRKVLFSEDELLKWLEWKTIKSAQDVVDDQQLIESQLEDF